MSSQPAPPPPEDGDNRRAAERHNLTGAQIKLHFDGAPFTLHLKDLSSAGVCGLTDAPLVPGQKICLVLDKWEPVAAEVKWIRKALIGVAFAEALPAEQVKRLKRVHLTKRSRRN